MNKSDTIKVHLCVKIQNHDVPPTIQTAEINLTQLKNLVDIILNNNGLDRYKGAYAELLQQMGADVVFLISNVLLQLMVNEDKTLGDFIEQETWFSIDDRSVVVITLKGLEAAKQTCEDLYKENFDD